MDTEQIGGVMSPDAVVGTGYDGWAPGLRFGFRPAGFVSFPPLPADGRSVRAQAVTATSASSAEPFGGPSGDAVAWPVIVARIRERLMWFTAAAYRAGYGLRQSVRWRQILAGIAEVSDGRIQPIQARSVLMLASDLFRLIAQAQRSFGEREVLERLGQSGPDAGAAVDPAVWRRTVGQRGMDPARPSRPTVDRRRPIGEPSAARSVAARARGLSLERRSEAASDSANVEALTSVDGVSEQRPPSARALRDLLRREGGEGAAPDAALRARLTRYVGFDPGLARLHQGPAASQAARRLRAEAFAIGTDIFFAEGRLSPSTPRGLALLAHELTHVRQQTHTLARLSFWTQQGGDAMEHEAQSAAAKVLADSASAGSDPVHVGQPIHRDTPATRPALAFALPAPAPTKGGPLPSSTATEERGNKPTPTIRQADARAVTDAVYALMREEVLQARRRGLDTQRRSLR